MWTDRLLNHSEDKKTLRVTLQPLPCHLTVRTVSKSPDVPIHWKDTTPQRCALQMEEAWFTAKITPDWFYIDTKMQQIGAGNLQSHVIFLYTELCFRKKRSERIARSRLVHNRSHAVTQSSETAAWDEMRCKEGEFFRLADRRPRRQPGWRLVGSLVILSAVSSE